MTNQIDTYDKWIKENTQVKRQFNNAFEVFKLTGISSRILLQVIEEVAKMDFIETNTTKI